MAFGLLHLFLLPGGRSRLREDMLLSISAACADVPAALPALSMSVCLNIRLHATVESLYCCWYGELDKMAIFMLFVVV